MKIDYDFWNDLDIEKDLIIEEGKEPYERRLHPRIERIKHVFIYIYNYFNNFISKI